MNTRENCIAYLEKENEIIRETQKLFVDMSNLDPGKTALIDYKEFLQDYSKNSYKLEWLDSTCRLITDYIPKSQVDENGNIALWVLETKKFPRFSPLVLSMSEIKGIQDRMLETLERNIKTLKDEDAIAERVGRKLLFEEDIKKLDKMYSRKIKKIRKFRNEIELMKIVLSGQASKEEVEQYYYGE